MKHARRLNDPLKDNFTVDKKCKGTSDSAKTRANLAYEDGIFIVKSAGNDGDSTASCQCMVTNPGDAEGVFPVAALRVIDGIPNIEDDSIVTNQLDVRNAMIASSSARGGGELGGFTATTRERTLIGISAPTNHSFVSSCMDNSTCNNSDLSEYFRTNPGTSFAAPVVSAAAISLKHMWIQDLLPSTWLDNAGHMRTQILLMGDRTNGTSRITKGFSDRYGAGRLKMRHRSSMGMDAPSLAVSGHVDIEDGEIFERWISTSGSATALPSAADHIKIVAWWFESDTLIVTPYISLSLSVMRNS